MIDEYKTLYNPIIAPAGSYVSRNRFENILQDLFEENTNIVNKLNEVIRKLNALDPEDMSEIEKLREDITALQLSVENLTAAIAGKQDSLTFSTGLDYNNGVLSTKVQSLSVTQLVPNYTFVPMSEDDRTEADDEYVAEVQDGATVNFDCSSIKAGDIIEIIIDFGSEIGNAAIDIKTAGINFDETIGGEDAQTESLTGVFIKRFLATTNAETNNVTNYFSVIANAYYNYDWQTYVKISAKIIRFNTLNIDK